MSIVSPEFPDSVPGIPRDDEVLNRFDALVRRQVMAMKTTFTSGHYRRRVAGVLAHRLLERLYEG